jgi:AraC family transcriptional regulator
VKATETHPKQPAMQGENGAWKRIQGTWQLLHGSFPEMGLSIEWHDFRVEQDMDWGRSFHPGSLEICLNFSGNGVIQEGEAERTVGPNQVSLCTSPGRKVHARRSADTLHRFLTVELSPEFLRTHFGDELEMLKPPVRKFIEQGVKAPPYLEVKTLPAALLPARVQFVEPPVPEAARRTWYLGRVLEILAQTIFLEESPGELFCQKHQRTNRERIERVRFLIERDLENPPSLEMLAGEVGCSTFYMSRIFAQETGASIPKFLRMKRIEKAAVLIRGGKHNVTEAAMAVGYSSLGAFTKAFVEQMGCCPGLYPLRTIKTVPGRKVS